MCIKNNSKRQPIVNYNHDQKLKEAFKNAFINYQAEMALWALRSNVNFELLRLCNLLDSLDLAYRRYVIGIHLNMRPVNDYLRMLLNYNNFKKQYAAAIIRDVEKDIITNELYELMGRHLYAKQKTKELIGLDFEDEDNSMEGYNTLPWQNGPPL
jgi:hypothetical protein